MTIWMEGPVGQVVKEVVNQNVVEVVENKEEEEVVGVGDTASFKKMTIFWMNNWDLKKWIIFFIRYSAF